MEIREFLLKHEKIFLPFVVNKFNISMEKLRDHIVELWSIFPSPQMVENMLHTNYKDECKYYEICNTKYNRGKSILASKLEDHCYYNVLPDQHISVFRHDHAWYTNVRTTNSVSCRDTWVTPDWIYLELDRDGYQQALVDAIVIYEKFPYKDHMVLWFSGNRSVHIAVHASLFGYPTGKQENVCGIGKLYYNLAHKICGAVRHGRGIVDPWLMDENELLETYYEITREACTSKDLQKIRQELENIDPNLYRVNSLIRQPWSIHEKTNQMKALIHPNPEKKYEKIKLDIKPTFPYLIHWVNECYEPKYKEKFIDYSYKVNTSKIEKIYSDLEGFDLSYVDQNGWINGLFSPFYDDTNPSVAVNLQTGVYKDHGNPTHTFGIVDFYAKYKNISNEKARQIIESL